MPFSFKALGDNLKKASNTVVSATSEGFKAASEATSEGFKAASEATQKVGASVVQGVGEFQQFLSLDGYLNFSADTLQGCIDGKTGKDLAIPTQLIQQAKGIVLLSEIKAGFIVAGKGGIGMMMAHLDDGSWSGPIALAVGGLSGGAQVGASSIHSVLLLNTKAAVEHFASNAQVRLGASVGVAAGPVGRDLDAHVALSKTKPSPIYSYSFSQGLFAGASLSGAVLSVRWKENNKFYGSQVTSRAILDGKTRYSGTHAGLDRIYNLMADLPDVVQMDLNAFLGGEQEVVVEKVSESEPVSVEEKEDKEPQKIILDPTLESDDDAPKPVNAESDDDAPKPSAESDDDAPKPDSDEEDAPKPPVA